MDELIVGQATINAASTRALGTQLARVSAAIRSHLLAPGLDAACARVVAEATRRDRPLAWNDVTGNLRASIQYQVEDYVGADPVRAVDASGDVYNTEEYRSGNPPRSGEYGIVFAPPDYAVHVEAKSSRSVLLEPVSTMRSALLQEVAEASRREWDAFVGTEMSRRGHVG